MKAQITNRVGTGSSANLAHDVALIQAMLKVIKNKAGHPYFPSAMTVCVADRRSPLSRRFKPPIRPQPILWERRRVRG